MSINKLALIRYKTIDNCLQNKFRKWTLDDLMEACSEILYEYEGIDRGVSKRTIQMDIQNMRSEKLGYNAPIVVREKKYYAYQDNNYSITNIPLTKQDLSILSEVLGVLKQFKGFNYFQEISGMVTKLEDKLYKQQHKGFSFIDFEKNDLLKGLEHIDVIHKSIINEQTLIIKYKSFKAKEPNDIIFYPYLLKEYRNRWFLFGKKSNTILTLALDRIEEINLSKEVFFKNSDFDVQNYFNDVIGVTKTQGQIPQLIVLKITKEHAPYISTKPIHHSQKIIKEDIDGTIFSIEVIWNFELEREILGFGEYIKVLSPKRLAGKIISRNKKSLSQYITGEF